MFIKLFLVSLGVNCLVQFNTVLGQDCVMPNGQNGTCVEIFECSPLLKSFINPQPETQQHLNLFKCEADVVGVYKVCCHNSLQRRMYKGEVSNRRYCGYQHKDDYEGNSATTSIDEFPWVAAMYAIKHRTGEEELYCHGVLINARYVLSGALCFSEIVRRQYTLTNKIRLGEFYVLNNTDCVDVPDIDTQDCNEAVNVEIEKVITHPNYHQGLSLYDIALVRLKVNVAFSDYIRPICLPRANGNNLKYGTTLYTTGWGLTGHKYSSSSRQSYATTKKRILTKLTTNEECDNLLQENLEKTEITNLRICTIDEVINTEFSCSGDAGAPVMHTVNNQWEVVGIVSSGANCGMGLPSFNTKVSMFIEWIQDNIEPF